MITRTFKLCLNAGTGSAPFINVSQTDRDEVWLFELYTETGERYIPSSGAIIGIKADGHGIANNGTVDSEGRVVITETQQMTASAGRAIFELSIDGLTHGTANFIVNVEKKPIDGAIMSDSDLSLISQAVDSAAVIVDVIGDSDPSEVIGEHVDAWLDNHPEATTTVLDGAITAPKINSTLWDKLLVSEEASGAVASFDDGADDVPVSSLKVALEPIQTGSGDPSPSNVRPIYPASDKNLLQITATTQTINGVTFTVNSDGSVDVDGTPTATAEFVLTDNLNFLTVGERYILNGSKRIDTSICKLSVYNNQDMIDYGVGVTFVVASSGQRYLRIVAYTGQEIHEKFWPMIRRGDDSDPTFAPYQGIGVRVANENLLRGVRMGRTNNGVTYVMEDGGAITMSGTASGSSYLSPSLTFEPSANALILLQAGTYTLSASGLSNNVKMRLTGFKQSDPSVAENVTNYSVNGETFTINEPYYVYLQVQVLSGTNTDGMVVKPMLVRGTTAAEFVPYHATDYPVSLGQNVYGGTVDLATGVLTVTHGVVQSGSASDYVRNNGTQYYLKAAEASGIKSPSAAEATVMSDRFKQVLSGASGVAYLNTGGNIRFNTADSYNTVQEMLTAIGAPQFVYPLATPTTVQLTPTEVKTLLGYNNISSSGTVEVIYHADTKLYVDKMTNVDNAIVAPTEEGFTATRNYTVNDLVIVNDTLYKVTSNIASGSTITPNSNVTQTTLGALIKALS